ncbi:hypothetical protein CDAR_316921 [Caerostris darwini]|uniref:Uncharacterized protein n=1 Tax=Caerostris darwini TaxID=1538125 RepID=A0AAV4Q378_9ARAC|nr:hypothetical protein CDAR_316921 [Caerostris darwini]
MQQKDSALIKYLVVLHIPLMNLERNRMTPSKYLGSPLTLHPQMQQKGLQPQLQQLNSTYGIEGGLYNSHHRKTPSQCNMWEINTLFLSSSSATRGLRPNGITDGFTYSFLVPQTQQKGFKEISEIYTYILKQNRSTSPME